MESLGRGEGGLAAYSYKAYDGQGHSASGVIQAASQRQAAELVAGQGLYVVEMKRSVSLPLPLHWLRRQFHRQYVMMFCRQCAVMVKAGLPISECLQVLAREERNGFYQGMVENLSRRVQEGQSFSASLGKYPSVFPLLVVRLIHVGEVSGNLDAVLEELAGYLEAAYKAREKLVTLMIYPMILLTVTLLVLLFLLQFILPTFAALFLSLHAELPLPTRLLLGLQAFLHDYGYGLLLGMGVLALGAGSIYRNQRYRWQIDGWLLRIPLLGKLLVYSELLRFSRTLALLLSSGIRMDQALLILHETTGNAYLQQLFLRLRSDIQKGGTLAASLEQREIFPAVMMNLLATGELTGELEMILEKMADFCRGEADTLSERLRALLEPAMILFMGCLVGFVIFAVAMPVLDAMTAYTGF